MNEEERKGKSKKKKVSEIVLHVTTLKAAIVLLSPGTRKIVASFELTVQRERKKAKKEAFLEECKTKGYCALNFC